MSEPERTAPVAVDGLVVGPDEWLVLSPRHAVSRADLQHMAERLPEALKGRVLIVDQMDMAVVQAEPSEAIHPSFYKAENVEDHDV